MPLKQASKLAKVWTTNRLVFFADFFVMSVLSCVTYFSKLLACVRSCLELDEKSSAEVFFAFLYQILFVIAAHKVNRAAREGSLGWAGIQSTDDVRPLDYMLRSPFGAQCAKRISPAFLSNDEIRRNLCNVL